MAVSAKILTLPVPPENTERAPDTQVEELSFNEIDALMNESKGQFLQVWLSRPETRPILNEALKQIAAFSAQVVNQVTQPPPPLLDLLNEPITTFTFETPHDRTRILRIFRICGIQRVGDIFLKKESIKKTRNVGPITLKLLNQCLKQLSPSLQLDAPISSDILQMYSSTPPR